jgi:hypothetical protein
MRTNMSLGLVLSLSDRQNCKAAAAAHDGETCRLSYGGAPDSHAIYVSNPEVEDGRLGDQAVAKGVLKLLQLFLRGEELRGCAARFEFRS